MCGASDIPLLGIPSLGIPSMCAFHRWEYRSNMDRIPTTKWNVIHDYIICPLLSITSMGFPVKHGRNNHYIWICHLIRWHSIVGYYVVGYSGQTWTEYPQNIISYMTRWHSIVGYSAVRYSVVGYSRRWVSRTVTDDIPLLGIPVILPGIPNDQNTRLFCWVFWSLGILAVGYSRCWVFRTVTCRNICCRNIVLSQYSARTYVI